MPLVVVRYKPDLVPDPVLEAITQALPEIVASALHVDDEPEAHLIPKHIMVDTQAVGRFSVNANCIDIFIDANEYDGRLFTIDNRRHAIVEGIRSALAVYTFVTCGVWVRLVRGSYEEL